MSGINLVMHTIQKLIQARKTMSKLWRSKRKQVFKNVVWSPKIRWMLLLMFECKHNLQVFKNVVWSPKIRWCCYWCLNVNITYNTSGCTVLFFFNGGVIIKKSGECCYCCWNVKITTLQCNGLLCSIWALFWSVFIAGNGNNALLPLLVYP